MFLLLIHIPFCMNLIANVCHVSKGFASSTSNFLLFLFLVEFFYIDTSLCVYKREEFCFAEVELGQTQILIDNK